MDWALRACGWHGHYTYAPDEQDLAERLHVQTVAVGAVGGGAAGALRAGRRGGPRPRRSRTGGAARATAARPLADAGAGDRAVGARIAVGGGRARRLQVPLLARDHAGRLRAGSAT